MADINPFTASFANPWPTLPELIPTSNNTEILFKYLAYHAAAVGPAATTTAKEIYPWMRESHGLKRSPFHQQTGGVTTLVQPNHHYGGSQVISSSESLASPVSPQPTPPISLSPGKTLDFKFDSLRSFQTMWSPRAFSLQVRK